MINFSLTEGIFPSQFKQAVITPLIKKASLNKNELKNYRPVSGLIYLSKLTERVVASQLQNHFEKNKLFNVWQSAYRPGHSTESALLRVKNDIHMSMAKGNVAALVLLDLSAAFDTIDHQILLHRLSAWFGLGGTVLDWFTSYLNQSTQNIKIGDTLSEPTSLEYGVPQGSVLGPLLFTTYTTPISNIIHESDHIYHHLYADDTQVYISLTPGNAQTTFSTLQVCLSAVQSWMSKNMLKLNPDKTEFLLIGTENKRNKLSALFPITILGNDTSPCAKVRNLGVVFDANFSFAQHVSSICSSCHYHIREFL